MRAFLVPIVLVVSIATASACASSGASERCQAVCKRDAECFDEAREEEDDDERSYRFDRDECEGTCAFLERDTKGREMVAAHATCVANADSCDAVRACP